MSRCSISSPLKTLREARITWRRQHHRTLDHVEEETTLIVGHVTSADIGWRTTGDALLANTAAAEAPLTLTTNYTQRSLLLRERPLRQRVPRIGAP